MSGAIIPSVSLRTLRSFVARALGLGVISIPGLAKVHYGGLVARGFSNG